MQQWHDKTFGARLCLAPLRMLKAMIFRCIECNAEYYQLGNEALDHRCCETIAILFIYRRPSFPRSASLPAYLAASPSSSSMRNN
jgi:hypothetical protein